jgi:hypothetical protein
MPYVRSGGDELTQILHVIEQMIDDKGGTASYVRDKSGDQLHSILVALEYYRTLL